MPFWNVTGADESTGGEKTVRIYAENADEAEARGREQGLLISAIQPASSSQPIPPATPYKPPPSTPKRRRLKWSEPPDDGIPQYQGLEAGRLMFFWLAWLTAAGVVIGIIALIGYLLLHFDTEGVEVFRAGCAAIFSLCLLTACEFAASAGCAAMRDIARNSWRIANNSARPS